MYFPSLLSVSDITTSAGLPYDSEKNVLKTIINSAYNKFGLTNSANHRISEY